ncbi:MAG TPA: pitrilysin family protein, partial [Myxococcaceae bacterium]|nr:pitrilysin family protein [Myxococcaceae bacterium]
MMKSDLKLLAGTLAALSLACTAAREETRPTPPPSPPVAAAPAAPPEPPSTPDEPWRNEKPAPLPTTPKFEPPVPTERKLKNGAMVLVAENHALPLIAIDVVIKTGVNAEPISKAGLAGFNMAMLDEGTKTRKSLEISAQLEDLAAELSGGAGMESSRLHLNCLAETLPQCLEILADVVQNPAYRPEDLERIRGLLLTSLEQKKGVPGVIANDVAGRLLYGDKHPWGQPDGGTPATIKAITRDDLARFHDTWFRPNNAIISVAGDV